MEYYQLRDKDTGKIFRPDNFHYSLQGAKASCTYWSRNAYNGPINLEVVRVEVKVVETIQRNGPKKAKNPRDFWIIGKTNVDEENKNLPTWRKAYKPQFIGIYCSSEKKARRALGILLLNGFKIDPLSEIEYEEYKGEEYSWNTTFARAPLNYKDKDQYLSKVNLKNIYNEGRLKYLV